MPGLAAKLVRSCFGATARRLGAVAVLATLALPAPAQGSAEACPKAQPAASSGAVRDRGLLWRISRGGHSSWLFGTLHVGRPDWARFGPRTAAAVQASDTLALELDPTDPAVQEALADAGRWLELPTALQRRLSQAYERACIAPAALAALHPVLQASTLTVLEARWLGLDPQHSIELVLARQAKAAGRKVVSLESVALQKETLVPADAQEALKVVEQSLAQLEDRSARRVLATLAEAWERGELARLENYAAWCECSQSDEEKAFMRRLNDHRNPGLAERVSTLHGQGRRLFVAVGALHMTGEQALPRLLAAAGFKVERIAFRP
jgi:uncharacterized protein